jgi:hypothetical protein
VRAYLADTLTGHQALLVVGSNSQATELSARIHDELVRLGHVQPLVLAATRDGNPVGAGDLIQARRNDASIPVEGAGTVTNRATYRVLGGDPATGEVQVADAHGRRAQLPAAYVAEHVTLAYASTVYAAQGRTVDTCHALVEPGADRRSVYVAMTRGRHSNTAYVVCERDPDGHLPEQLDSTARAQLAAAITCADHNAGQAAETARRTGLDEERSLSWIATQWDLVTTQACSDQCIRTVTTLLDPATARTLLAEPGYPRLIRAIRAAQLAGHDADSVLIDAVHARSLFGANSMSDVLRWRISITTASRAPEHVTSSGGWVAMTLARGGAVGEYALALAQLAETRQHELGRRTAVHQPDWAVHHLGPPPPSPADHPEWVRRAGVIAAYRDLAAIPDETVSLGPAPPREQVLHRALWQRAHTAAGAPTDELDYTTATDTQLRQLRDVYRRELDWAPPWVHDELRDAHLAATGYHRDAELWAAEAQLLPVDSTERARADADVHNAQQLAATYQARAEQLQILDAARRRWHHDTEPVRTRSEHAGIELSRRGLPRDHIPESAEQTSLFDPPTAHAESPVSVSTRQTSGPGAGEESGSALLPASTEQAGQALLFTLTPDPRDLAATSTLGSSSDTPAHSRGAPVTLAEALRQLEITADLRARHSRWTDALDQLEQQAGRHRGHDGPDDYLRRSRDARELQHELDQDLDQGMEL